MRWFREARYVLAPMRLLDQAGYIPNKQENRSTAVCTYGTLPPSNSLI